MSCCSTSGAWFVAAGVGGAVEALKDQGFCRWNRRRLAWLHQSLEGDAVVGSSSASTPGRSTDDGSSRRARQSSEDSLRTVMFLSCWGPN